MGDMTAARAPGDGQLEREQAYFGFGTHAEHPFGVLYQGEYETLADGTAIAVRRHAKALASTGIPVQLRSFSNLVANAHGVFEPAHLGIPKAVEDEVGELRRMSVSMLTPVIKHAVIASAEHARNVLVPRGAISLGADVMETVQLRRAICGNTILYTVWERDSIDETLARELNRAAQLWVPCVQNAQMLERSGVDPVLISVVPHPFDPNDKLNRLVRRQPTDWRLFYAIGRWEPRKAYAELIAAFLQAFEPTDKVVLTIKYSGGTWQNYPTPDEAFERALAAVGNKWTREQANERVVLLDKHLSRDQIIELHFYNNIYVSCSHGEAWNLPAFEAKQAGNLLVHVPYGGTQDFQDHRRDVCIPIARLEPVHPSYGWGETKWAGYDIEALVTALRTAAAPTEYRQPELFERFNMANIGAQMHELVLRLAEQNNSQAAEYYLGKIGETVG
jgi:glycosyltransferase involved in cell wall biosynthesis